MIVTDHQELLWAWVNKRLGTPWSSDTRLIGLVKGDCVRAVAAYNAWAGRTCCFHGAIDDPKAIDRTFIRAIFDYPFNQCGATHMFALISEDNQRSLSFCHRSGFKEIRRLGHAGLEGEDMILLELRREECRWIKGPDDGQEERSSSRAGLHGSSESTGAGVPAEHCVPDCSEPA